MDKREADGWLQRYVGAWKSYEPDAIADLFSEDVTYRYHPYDEPIVGRRAVVESWLGTRDEPGASARDVPGTYDAEYRTIAIDGDVVVATGSSTYLSAPGGAVAAIYDNCLVIRFDPSGRCRDFTEWYVKRPED